jgi:hypothetical protein
MDHHLWPPEVMAGEGTGVDVDGERRRHAAVGERVSTVV